MNRTQEQNQTHSAKWPRTDYSVAWIHFGTLWNFNRVKVNRAKEKMQQFYDLIKKLKSPVLEQDLQIWKHSLTQFCHCVNSVRLCSFIFLYGVYSIYLSALFIAGLEFWLPGLWVWFMHWICSTNGFWSAKFGLHQWYSPSWPGARAKISMLSRLEGWQKLSSINHGETGQLRVSLSLYMLKRADSTFCLVSYYTLWHSLRIS